MYLIRHGQIDGYENSPVYGHTDMELTETGGLQMQQISERLRLTEPKAIYSSDLKRCKIGARIIGCYHDIPLYFLPELRELFLGEWEGITLSELQSRFPKELQKRQANLLDYEPPGGGESIGRFCKRITDCFEHILEKEKNNDIIMVCHGAVNRIIICKALGLNIADMFNIHQDYGCLNIIDYFSDSKIIRLING